MKHIVHVTVTMSVEVDDAELKKEFGKSSKRLILETAKSLATLNSMFDSKAEIVGSYDDEHPKVKKGKGSY